MKKSISLKIVAILLAWIISANVTATKVTVYVIGDSTASLYDASSYPRTGWAQVLQPFFLADSVVVNDQAASGRSSKSFYDEGRWTTVYNMLKPGDYVLIQFAHNDEKTTDATRYTDPSTTFKDYLTIYANGAIAKGATPVFITSIPRNNWSGTSVQTAHKPYSDSMKSLGITLQVPVLDMEASTMAYLNSKGKTYATDSVFNNLAANVWPNYLTGNSDGTHLQENGAFQFARTLTSDFKNHTQYAKVVRLAANLRDAHLVKAMPSPALKGTLKGYGVYQKGATVTLTATPVSGFKFVKWTNTTDTVTISKSSTLTIANLSNELSYLARFESITALNNASEAKLCIYPTLVQSTITIDGYEQIKQYNICTIEGKQVSTGNILNSNKLNVAQLQPGFYSLSFLKTNGGLQHFSFIKQ